MPKLYRDATTARHETPDVAELRRLLDAATPGPWRDEMMQGQGLTLTAIIAGKPNPDDLRVIGSTLAHNDARAIVAAVNALPALLDAAAERDALAAKVARVRALHASSGTAESQGYDGEGEYGLIAPYCTGCEASDEYATAWPCPTIRALDATPDTGGESCDLCKRGHELAGDSDYMSTDTHRGL